MNLKNTILAVGLLSLLASAGLAQEGEVYELEIGGKKYSIELDKAIKVTTPKGKRVRVVLRAPETVKFEWEGIRCRRPRTTSTSTAAHSTHVTATFETTDSVLMVVQQHRKAVEPAALEDAMVEAIHSKFTQFGVKPDQFKQEPTERLFSKVKRKGQRLKFPLAGSDMTTDVFAWTTESGTPVIVMLQHDSDDAEAARHVFDQIAGSLEFTE